MCFSAEASFGMSVVLAPAGIYCVRTALVKNRAFLCLAVIPLVFSVQQFTEGLVWMGIEQKNDPLTRRASLIFLAFALAFWPFWIPLCGFLLEPEGKRKWIQGAAALLGLSGGLVLFVPLAWNPAYLTVRSPHHSVFYDLSALPILAWIPMEVCELLYLAVVALPPLLSRTTGFFLFSIAIVISAVISHAFFWYASASVWCFFAAVLSLYLCISFHGMPALQWNRGSRCDNVP